MQNVTKKKQELIVNKTDSNGTLLCPECGHGSVWKDAMDGKMYTNPLVKVDIPGAVKALVHRCCTGKLVSRVMRERAEQLKGEQKP